MNCEVCGTESVEYVVTNHHQYANGVFVREIGKDVPCKTDDEDKTSDHPACKKCVGALVEGVLGQRVDGPILAANRY